MMTKIQESIKSIRQRESNRYTFKRYEKGIRLITNGEVFPICNHTYAHGCNCPLYKDKEVACEKMDVLESDSMFKTVLFGLKDN